VSGELRPARTTRRRGALTWASDNGVRIGGGRRQGGFYTGTRRMRLLPTMVNQGTECGDRAATRWAPLGGIFFHFQKFPKTDFCVRKQIRGGRKSNLEHFLLLILLPILYGF
jgi:hypothetical protein